MTSLTDFLTECTINEDAKEDLRDLLSIRIGVLGIRSRVTPQGKFIFSPTVHRKPISPDFLRSQVRTEFTYSRLSPTSWTFQKEVATITMDEANTITSLALSLGALALLNLHPAFAEIHAKDVDFAVELYSESSPSDYIFDLSIRECWQLYADDEFNMGDMDYFNKYFLKMVEHYKRYGYNFMTSKMFGDIKQIKISYGPQ